MAKIVKTTVATRWSDPSWTPTAPGTTTDNVIGRAVGGSARNALAVLRRRLLDPEAEGMLGAPGVAVYLRDGWVYAIEPTYTLAYARMHPDEFTRLLEWWIAIMESPDFRNPDAVIEPIEIEYDLEIPDDLHPELSQAMGVADEIIIADKFTRGRKLDDGAIFVWEPIEPWGRGFIWDPEDETWLLSPSSISHEQQIANWNNGQRTTVDDL